MGEKPQELKKLRESLNVLEVNLIQNSEKITKTRLKAAISIEVALSQYAECGAFVLGPHPDSVNAFLTDLYERLPALFLPLLSTAPGKYQLIGMQLACKVISLHFQLTKSTQIREYPIVKTLLETWKSDSAMFLAGKQAVLTQYSDLALAFTQHFAKEIEAASSPSVVFPLLKDWPVAAQVNDFPLLKGIGKDRKRGRISKVENFDPLLAGCKREVDETGFSYQYGQALGECWAALFRKSLPRPDLLESLDLLPDRVLPHLSEPLILSDFLLVISILDVIFRARSTTGYTKSGKFITISDATGTGMQAVLPEAV